MSDGGRMGTMDREVLGKVVRQAWVDYCRETGDDKPSHVAPWDDLGEWDREADRRIGEAVATALAGSGCHTQRVPGDDGTSVRVRREDITPVLVERCAEAAWYARHHLSWDGAYDGSRDSYRQATRVALETAFVALAAAGATGEGGGSDASG